MSAAYYVVVNDRLDATVQVLAGEKAVAEVVVDGGVGLHLCRAELVTGRPVGVRLLLREVELPVHAAQHSFPLLGGTPTVLVVVDWQRRRLSCVAASTSKSGLASTAGIDHRSRRRDDQQGDNVEQAEQRRSALTLHLVS